MTQRTPKDLPRKELMEAADNAMQRYQRQHPEVHFKFTCKYCGTRCTLQEPNVLYENGECFACGQTTSITQGGFMLTLRFPEKGEGKEDESA